MKAAVKRVLGRLCEASGFGWAMTRMRPGAFTVLMFHRVAEEGAWQISANRPLLITVKNFQRLAETLADRCQCLPLVEACQRANTGKASARPVVAVTFDDGYGDFAQLAFPILRALGIPSTVYLATGHLDDPERFFWWDGVEAAFAGPLDADVLARAGLPGDVVEQVAAMARTGSIRDVEAFIRGPMRRLSPGQRLAFLDAAGLPRARPPAMLTWEKVQELAATGLVDFGAHTVNHPFLDEVGFADALAEVKGSKERIETQTGRPVTSFAYPSGHVPEYHAALLEQAGIPYGLTTSFGVNDAASDPLLLKRMDARLALAGEDVSPAFCTAVIRGCFNWLQAIRGA